MGFTILATSDEGTIFVGKCSDNKISFGNLAIATPKRNIWSGGKKTKTYKIKTDVIEVELIDEEQFRTAGKTAAWGLAGLAIAGPLGAAFGGYFGGKGDKAVCGIKLKDGRSFLAQMSQSQYKKVSGHLVTGKKISAWKDRLEN